MAKYRRDRINDAVKQEMAQILRISENYFLSTYKTQFGL